MLYTINSKNTGDDIDMSTVTGQSETNREREGGVLVV